jgi:hypothetical protein
MDKEEDDYRYPISITFTIPETSIEVIIRNIRIDDIGKILELQEASFADMAAYGMVWPASYLKKHIHIFPEGQLCADIDGKIVASASSLIVTLKPQYSRKVIEGKIEDPVLSFQLKNGFKFIKVLPNYLYDRRSMNYSNFLEWSNPHYH